MLGLVVSVCGGISGYAEDDDASAPVEAKGALERLAGLSGTWVLEEAPADQPGNTFVYKVVGAGSAVVEELFPGSDHAMVSVYHLDGDELVMTHYCAARNQPRMQLDREASTADEYVFKFIGGTNFDPVKDMHMHEGRILFLPDGRVKSEWTGYDQGKPTGTHAFTLKRP